MLYESSSVMQSNAEDNCEPGRQQQKPIAFNIATDLGYSTYPNISSFPSSVSQAMAAVQPQPYSPPMLRHSVSSSAVSLTQQTSGYSSVRSPSVMSRQDSDDGSEFASPTPQSPSAKHKKQVPPGPYNLKSARRAGRGHKRAEIEDEDDGTPCPCPHCGKEYRQNNSLYKHLYEHHPYWQEVAKTFNLSKHQQVMLMQSAEVLLSFKRPDSYAQIPPVRF